jgi:hypothetical protein
MWTVKTTNNTLLQAGRLERERIMRSRRTGECVRVCESLGKTSWTLSLGMSEVRGIINVKVRTKIRNGVTIM